MRRTRIDAFPREIGHANIPMKTVHSSLKYHLETQHNLDAKAMVPFIPPLPSNLKWIAQTCFVDSCSTALNTHGGHTQHLRNVHGFNTEDAKTEIVTRAQFISIVPEVKVGTKRAPSAKETKKAKRTKT